MNGQLSFVHPNHRRSVMDPVFLCPVRQLLSTHNRISLLEATVVNPEAGKVKIVATTYPMPEPIYDVTFETVHRCKSLDFAILCAILGETQWLWKQNRHCYRGHWAGGHKNSKACRKLRRLLFAVYKR